MLTRLFKGIFWLVGLASLTSAVLMPVVFGGYEQAIDYFMENYAYEFTDNSYDEYDYQHETDDDIAYDEYGDDEYGYESDY